MKKKCFNDKFGQTEAILNGTKTMFREVYKCPNTWCGIRTVGYRVFKDEFGNILRTSLIDEDGYLLPGSYIMSKYSKGEIITVAQSYEDAESEWIKIMMNDKEHFNLFKLETIHRFNSVSYPSTDMANKTIVKADLMPHQIKITGIKLERLQDISDEDCIKEGIYDDMGDNPDCYFYDYRGNEGNGFDTPKEAFAALADRLYGKGTWEQNPYVIAYEFELIK